MFDGLAFLPVDDVPDGLAYLKENTPIYLEQLLDYFNSTNISMSFRRIQLLVRPDDFVPPLERKRRMPLTCSPPIWNVQNITLNNIYEDWNNFLVWLVMPPNDLVCHRQYKERPGHGCHSCTL